MAKTNQTAVDNKEYQAIVAVYTGKDGKVSYDLINKDMIKFANSSKIVRQMIEDKKSPEEITRYAVGMKFRNLTGNRELTDDQALAMLEMLDKVNAKGVLKEFNEEIRKKLAGNKKK